MLARLHDVGGAFRLVCLHPPLAEELPETRDTGHSECDSVRCLFPCGLLASFGVIAGSTMFQRWI